MQIREVMTSNPRYVEPDTNLRQAADLMRRLDVGVLPVSEGRKVSGILTDRDIVIRSTAEGRDPADHKVRDVATQQIARVYEDDDVEDARRLMKEKQIRRLPVLNRNDDLVGIVALADLAREVEPRKSGDVLEKVSRPS